MLLDPPPGFLELPSELRPEAHSFWQQMSASKAPTSLCDALSVRSDTATVWACSEFVAHSFVRAPELVADLITDGIVDSPVCPTALRAEAEEWLQHTCDEANFHQRLRRFRRRQMVRIAWRDLSGQAKLEETLQSVSLLADLCVRSALGFHHLELVERFGEPLDDNDQPVEMIVLGLGKLGGNELNYSSDIDLLLAFGSSGDTSGGAQGERSVSNQEFFIKLGRKLVQALDTVTSDGFVFRVDLRLRPNGDSGPIALSFAAMEHYYQTHGRSWERYALIKARLVAGGEDSGALLLDMLRPFVYRRYLDFGAFDALREMKQMIQTQVKKRGLEQDLKLGSGGIREIEFFVQCYQLIRGGRDGSLRTPSFYQAVAALAEIDVISEQCKLELTAAYRFLRNSEHRVQMWRDRQTQLLPKSETERLRLARSMGFICWSEYLATLDYHRTLVARLFAGIMQTDVRDADADPELKSLRDVWDQTISSTDSARVLGNSGIDLPEQVVTLVHQFRDGRLYQAFSSVDRDRLDRLMPLALQQAGDHSRSARSLAAFISVLESIGRRSVYLSLLIENPRALRQLLHLCAASPWLSRFIGQNPVVLDELIQPENDASIHSKSRLVEEFESRLKNVDADDEERLMNAEREFMHGQVLRIAAADINQRIDSITVMRALTNLATVLMRNSMSRAIETVNKKLRPPPTQAGVIAYGKFASFELGYHSDLDVVIGFLSPDDVNQSTHCDYFFSRVGQRFVHQLTTRTHAGLLYEIDLRLRPSGRSGTLVTSMRAFAEYQLQHAWTWEHQALVRSRVVYGDEEFRDAFEAVRSRVLQRPREKESLQHEIRTMRKKMVDNNSRSNDDLFDLKLDYGGLVDIEFILQYLVLLHACDCSALLQPRESRELIGCLHAENLLDDIQKETLENVMSLYLARTLELKLMDQDVLVPQQEMVEHRDAVKLLWSQIIG
ncbi:MAG: bifunctional [glutamate--ammonia ligase]-adenylyl-L-tyrosine phosphorylase/[glutamate--ammonia-ligase] adenylyltransferase [Pseudomonadota bacterium]